MKTNLRSAVCGGVAALLLLFSLGSVAIQSGATNDYLTVDPTSKAARVTLYSTTGTAALVDTTSQAQRVTMYDAAGRNVAQQSKVTYAASNTFTPALTATDIVTITGSGTKTIRLVSLLLATTNTAAGSQQFSVIKRSALDTTGTFVAATAVPLDSADPAATATVGHYTANPGALGTAVGTINTLRVASPVLVPASFAGVVTNASFQMLPIDPTSGLPRAVTLRGAAENLAINFGGAALVAGQVHAYTAVWTED